jgi:hypothetical protein
MSSDWYAPNQQAVRGDESGPAEQGEGGSERVDREPIEPREGKPGAPTATPAGTSDLDSMTKDELLVYAQQLGVRPANAAMSKDEIRAGIEARQAGQ